MYRTPTVGDIGVMTGKPEDDFGLIHAFAILDNDLALSKPSIDSFNRPELISFNGVLKSQGALGDRPDGVLTKFPNLADRLDVDIIWGTKRSQEERDNHTGRPRRSLFEIYRISKFTNWYNRNADSFQPPLRELHKELESNLPVWVANFQEIQKRIYQDNIELAVNPDEMLVFYGLNLNVTANFVPSLVDLNGQLLTAYKKLISQINKLHENFIAEEQWLAAYHVVRLFYTLSFTSYAILKLSGKISKETEEPYTPNYRQVTPSFFEDDTGVIGVTFPTVLELKLIPKDRIRPFDHYFLVGSEPVTLKWNVLKFSLKH